MWFAIARFSRSFAWVGTVALMTLWGSMPLLAQTQPSPIPPSVSQIPRFKRMSVAYRGVSQPITFQRYERIGTPATTYFPASYLTASGGCTEIGCGMGFYSQPDETKNSEGNFVRFFFPRQATTIEQLRQLATTGDQSLLRLNPSWTVGATQTSDLALPWMKEATPFTTPNGGKGRIILGENPTGEQPGQAFGILEIYQQNRESEFAPLFQAIYDNLEFTTAPESNSNP